VTKALGIHLLLDVAGVPFETLDDPALVERLLSATVAQMGAVLLGAHVHRLAPQGVSGVAVIAESHLTIHTWPERGEAAIDLFTCGNAARARAALDWLRWALGGDASRLREFRRGALAPEGPAQGRIITG
jgi:S-adenosylmethionine decarboxylase proenzyme